MSGERMGGRAKECSREAKGRGQGRQGLLVSVALDLEGSRPVAEGTRGCRRGGEAAERAFTTEGWGAREDKRGFCEGRRVGRAGEEEAGGHKARGGVI